MDNIIGYAYQHEDTGNTMFVDSYQEELGFCANNPRWQKGDAIYKPAYVEALEQEVERLKGLVECSRRVYDAFIDDGCYGEYVLDTELWIEFDAAFKGEG